MPKSIDILIECPFYIGEGKEFIACEGVIKARWTSTFLPTARTKVILKTLFAAVISEGSAYIIKESTNSTKKVSECDKDNERS